MYPVVAVITVAVGAVSQLHIHDWSSIRLERGNGPLSSPCGFLLPLLAFLFFFLVVCVCGGKETHFARYTSPASFYGEGGILLTMAGI